MITESTKYNMFGREVLSKSTGQCSTQWRREGGEGGMRPGRHYAGATFGGRKYGILKFDRSWRISVCIADSDIFTPS